MEEYYRILRLCAIVKQRKNVPRRCRKVALHDIIFSKYKTLKIFHRKEFFLFFKNEKERFSIWCLQKRKNVENDCSRFSERAQSGFFVWKKGETPCPFGGTRLFRKCIFPESDKRLSQAESFHAGNCLQHGKNELYTICGIEESVSWGVVFVGINARNGKHAVFVHGRTAFMQLVQPSLLRSV